MTDKTCEKCQNVIMCDKQRETWRCTFCEIYDSLYPCTVPDVVIEPVKENLVVETYDEKVQEEEQQVDYSAELGRYLLQGWTMLGEECPRCMDVR
jgi:uncharacterized Zn finger protein (UPF0148 family)